MVVTRVDDAGELMLMMLDGGWWWVGLGTNMYLAFDCFFSLKLGIKRHVAHFDLWSRGGIEIVRQMIWTPRNHHHHHHFIWPIPNPNIW